MGEWKATYRTDKYEVNSNGDVRNAKTKHVLQHGRIRNGYETVGLYYDGHQHMDRVHRLVAKAFVPQKDGCHVVNHIDGNKSNNSADNLEWCTPKENMRHGFEHGLCYRPETSGCPKRQIEIVETGERFKSVSECARFLDADSSGVFACLSGRRKTCRGYTFKYI